VGVGGIHTKKVIAFSQIRPRPFSFSDKRLDRVVEWSKVPDAPSDLGLKSAIKVVARESIPRGNGVSIAAACLR
jgi:hypothetical protein